MASLKLKFTQFVSPEKIIFFHFSVSTFLRTFALAVSGLIIMSWIKPAEMGIYNSYNILITYSFFLQLGVFNGLNREIPYLLGQGKEAEAMKLASVSLFFAKTLSFSILFLGVLVYLALLLWGIMPVQELKMLAAMILLTAISFYQNYLNVTYRTLKNFSVLSRINNVSSVLIFCSLLMVYFFAYNGLVLYYLFNGIVLLVLTHLHRPFKIKSERSLPELKQLVILGLPIFILGYLQQITRTFNRLILVMMGSVYLVGLFSPASAIYSAVFFLPSTLAQFLYPKFSFIYGKYGDKKMLIPYVNRIYLLSAILIVPTIIVSLTVLPWAFEKYIPQYTKGIMAAQAFLVCGVIDITTISLNVFYSIGKKRPVIYYTVVKMLLMFLIPLAAVRFFPLLTAVTMGTLISTTVSAIFGYLLLMKTLYADHN